MKIMIRRIVLAAIIALALVPGTNVMAASQKGKALKAYQVYLKKHKPSEIAESSFNDASYTRPDTNEIDRFFLYDINKDKVPEMFAFTDVNFRWFIVRIYTYRGGQVKLYKLKSGEDAVFSDKATANGSYDFYICRKNHIHNVWSGSTPIGAASYEKVYKRSGKKLKEYLCKDDKYTGMTTTYTRYGKTITAEKYASLTKNCEKKNVTYYDNTKKNRSRLKKNKLTISQ